MGNLIKIYEEILKNHDNPEVVEQLMFKYKEDFFNSYPKDRQQKLRQQQWVLDNTLNNIKNPTVRYNTFIEMFWKGIKEFEFTLKDPQPEKKYNQNKNTTAKIIPIK